MTLHRCLILVFALVLAAGCAERDAATTTSASGAADAGATAADASEVPAGAAGNADATYREGVHYTRLENPVQGAAGNEIVEVFSYACPACAQFQPEVDAWKRERGEAVSLRYVPAEFFPAWEPFAQAFHALHEIGAFSRAHRYLFNALYQRNQRAATIEEIAQVLAGAGIDAQQFLAAARSPEVATLRERSRAYVRDAGVTSTPTLVVAGRYRVERRQPAGVSPLDVADWLIENTP
jgi:thiol:disulfide interchange protein DsbA